VRYLLLMLGLIAGQAVLCYIVLREPPPTTDRPPTTPPTPQVWPMDPQPWAQDHVYLFDDRSFAGLDHLYAVRDRDVVVQVARFPGYTDREWYRRPVPDDLFPEVQAWAEQRGDLVPPFRPHGPWFACLTLYPDRTKDQGEAWFLDFDMRVRAWFRTLRRTFVDEQYRVAELPAWVTEDATVMRYFGDLEK
jgi:hypothetical protein